MRIVDLQLLVLGRFWLSHILNFSRQSCWAMKMNGQKMTWQKNKVLQTRLQPSADRSRAVSEIFPGLWSSAATHPQVSPVLHVYLFLWDSTEQWKDFICHRPNFSCIIPPTGCLFFLPPLCKSIRILLDGMHRNHLELGHNPELI